MFKKIHFKLFNLPEAGNVMGYQKHGKLLGLFYPIMGDPWTKSEMNKVCEKKHNAPMWGYKYQDTYLTLYTKAIKIL